MISLNLASKIAFKNCTPFIRYITKIDGTTIDDTEDLDLVMRMYKLLVHSSNYSDTADTFSKGAKFYILLNKQYCATHKVNGISVHRLNVLGIRICESHSKNHSFIWHDSIWFYSRDEPAHYDANFVDNNNFKPLKYKTKKYSCRRSKWNFKRHNNCCTIKVSK